MNQQWANPQPMNQQWSPYPQPQPGNGGNGVVYALVGLLGVLILVVGVLVALLVVGRDGDADQVAAAGQTQTAPAPGELGDGPNPTVANTVRETVTETHRVGGGGDSSGWGSSGQRWSSSNIYARCGRGLAGSSVTSCPFANNVADKVFAGNTGARYRTVRAYSPVTKKWYTMSCTLGGFHEHNATYKCTGGRNAVVYVPIAG